MGSGEEKRGIKMITKDSLLYTSVKLFVPRKVALPLELFIASLASPLLKSSTSIFRNIGGERRRTEAAAEAGYSCFTLSCCWCRSSYICISGVLRVSIEMPAILICERGGGHLGGESRSQVWAHRQAVWKRREVILLSCGGESIVPVR